MLSIATPFPQVGSYALLVHEGKTRLARIERRQIDTQSVTVSLPERPGAGGNITVLLSDLIDGTRLTPTERVEKDRKRSADPRSKAGRRHAELHKRDVAATILFEKLATLQVRASAA